MAHKSAAKFNFEKLLWLNGQKMRSLLDDSAGVNRLLEMALPFFIEKGYENKEFMELLVAAFAPSAVTLLDMVNDCSLVFDFDPGKALADSEVSKILNTQNAKAVLDAFLIETSKSDFIDLELFRVASKAITKRTGAKGKDLFYPLRLAITGTTSGPELNMLIPLLEKGKSVKKESLPKPILGVRERIEMMLARLGEI